LSYAPAVKGGQSSSTDGNKTYSYNNKLANKSSRSNNSQQRQPDTSQHYQTPIISSIQDISKSIRPISSTNNNNSLDQPKLRISQPGDVYEQEADRVAEKVMRSSSIPSIPFFLYSDVQPIGKNKTTTPEGKKIDKKSCSVCQTKEQQEKKIEISRKPSYASIWSQVIKFQMK
jgi:hypothetical protein